MATIADNSNRRLMPPVYFLVTLLLIAGLHWLIPIVTLVHAPWSYAGVVIIAAGFVVAIIAAYSFRKHETAIRPFEVSSALVTVGIYRFTRNPMYLGMVAILIGVAVVLGTLVSFLPIPVFAWLIQQRFILEEESMLAGTFGDRYIEYGKIVRRWI